MKKQQLLNSLQDSCHSLSNDAVLSNADRLDVRVIPATHEGGKRKKRHCDSQASIAPYRMRSAPRGKALVVEIEEFENDVYERRHGSNVDVDNLTQLFQQLHFEVVHEKNLNYRRFVDVLTTFSRDKGNA